MHKSMLPLGMGMLLAGCAGRAPAPVTVAAQPPVAVATAALPEGASPGMLVPTPLADGSFPTPNRGLTGAAAVWHLRAGLNVAALSCPGETGATIRAAYNRWLTRDKAPLARFATTYAATYPAAGRYDEAMTRLYNYYAQTPARPAFCAAAVAMVAELPALDAVALADGAAARLAMLDRPFTDFYRAYVAWRDGNAPRTVVATAATVVPEPLSSPPHRPALALDLSSLPPDSVVTAAR